MNTNLLASVVFSLSLAALAGCSSTNGVSSGPATGSSTDGGTAVQSGTTCSQILSCISTQSCSEQTCIDACIAKGSPDAQTAAKTLDACDQKNMCQDSTCLQTKCSSELMACQSQQNAGGSSAGASGGQSVPPGSVPANVVGTWVAGDSADLGAENQFVFNADGTASYVIADTTEGSSCVSTTTTKSDGTAVVDASSITIYEATSVTTLSQCGQTTNTPETPETLKFTYEVQMDGSVWVTDAACAAQYAGDTASQHAYCLKTYRKQ